MMSVYFPPPPHQQALPLLVFFLRCIIISSVQKMNSPPAFRMGEGTRSPGHFVKRLLEVKSAIGRGDQGKEKAEEGIK